jgi:fused signal recognition particle receptor
MHALLLGVWYWLGLGLDACGAAIGLRSQPALPSLGSLADVATHPAAGPGAVLWIGGLAAGLTLGGLILLGLFLYLRRAGQKPTLPPPAATLRPGDDKPARRGEKGADRAAPEGASKAAAEKGAAAAKATKKPATKPERPDGGALSAGLQKTRAGFIARIGELLRKKQIDADLLNQLEEVLLTADIGVKTASHIFEQVRSSLSRQELKDEAAVWSVIQAESRKLLSVDAPPLDYARSKPFVLLVVGVNGAGKTTTIGKLAAQLTGEGKKVILAAGDTFRAAAVEQLEIWGQRAGVPVVKGKEGGDPSSVIFEAIKRAQREGLDVVIADTAGRLHVKAELMEELAKVRRVIKKADPTAPHETFLVLDSTNGQNAIAQARTFKEMLEVTGIVLTKLDGTAKGGVILGIAHELSVPVRYIGIGEKIHDLRAFDAADFVDVLYEQADPTENEAREN